MACIDNIIGVRGVCGNSDTESFSGYYANDYPGITLQSASNSNNENTLTGYNYLVDLSRRMSMKLNNDILAYINSNYRVNTLQAGMWSTGVYDTRVISAGNVGNRRGIVVYKKDLRCTFKKIKLQRIRIYSTQTANTTLRIADTLGVVYTVNVSLTQDVIKELEVNKIFNGNEIQITLPDNIAVYSNKPNCGIGCGGTAKSECVRVMGVNGSQLNTTEGYGIEADIDCVCDFSTLICNMASDKIIWQSAFELYGAMFYDEMIKNQRLNYLTIYKSDQIKEQAQQGFESYRNYFEQAMQGFRRYIVQLDGGCKCVDCSGLNVKTSV